MQPVAAYEHFGLLAFCILLGGLTFIIWRWPQGTQYTFSQHVAVHRYRILYYIALFTITLPLLLLFFLKWFMPAFGLSDAFGIFLIVASLAQYACTLIPEVGGRMTTYHRLLAGVSGLSLIPPLVLLLSSDAITMAGKLVTAASLLVMVGIIFALFRGKGQHSRFLYLQVGYYAAFFASTLFIRYF